LVNLLGRRRPLQDIVGDVERLRFLRIGALTAFMILPLDRDPRFVQLLLRRFSTENPSLAKRARALARSIIGKSRNYIQGLLRLY
jgi:hypothetical protein